MSDILDKEVLQQSLIMHCIFSLHKSGLRTLHESYEDAIYLFGNKIQLSNMVYSIQYTTDYPSHFSIENFLINSFNHCEIKYDINRYHSISLYKGTDRLFVFDFRNKNLGCEYEHIWSVLLYQYNCDYYTNSDKPSIHKVISDFIKKYLNIEGFKPMTIQSWDNSI